MHNLKPKDSNLNELASFINERNFIDSHLVQKSNLPLLVLHNLNFRPLPHYYFQFVRFDAVIINWLQKTQLFIDYFHQLYSLQLLLFFLLYQLLLFLQLLILHHLPHLQILQILHHLHLLQPHLHLLQLLLPHEHFHFLFISYQL